MQASSHMPGGSTLKRVRAEDQPPDDDAHPPIKKPRESSEFDDLDDDSTIPATSSQDKGKQKMVDSPSPDMDTPSKTSENNAKLVAELEDELRWDTSPWSCDNGNVKHWPRIWPPLLLLVQAPDTQHLTHLLS